MLVCYAYPITSAEYLTANGVIFQQIEEIWVSAREPFEFCGAVFLFKAAEVLATRKVNGAPPGFIRQAAEPTQSIIVWSSSRRVYWLEMALRVVPIQPQPSAQATEWKKLRTILGKKEEEGIKWKEKEKWVRNKAGGYKTKERRHLGSRTKGWKVRKRWRQEWRKKAGNEKKEQIKGTGSGEVWYQGRKEWKRRNQRGGQNWRELERNKRNSSRPNG